MGYSRIKLIRKSKKCVIISPQIKEKFGFNNPEHYFKIPYIVSVKIYDIDLRNPSLWLLKSLTINNNDYENLCIHESFGVFLFYDDRKNSFEIWALKKNLEIVKIYEHLPTLELDKEKYRTNFFIEDQNASIMRLDSYKIYLTIKMIKDLDYGNYAMAFLEVQVDLREIPGLVLENNFFSPNKGRQSDVDENWQDKLNIVKW